MQTRGQVRQRSEQEQEQEQLKTLFLKLATESRDALTQLGSVFHQRNSALEQQLRDVRQSMERQRAQHLMQVDIAGQAQERSKEAVVSLAQQLNSQRRAYEAEKERAERLHRELAEQQNEQVKEAVVRVAQQLSLQRRAYDAEKGRADRLQRQLDSSAEQHRADTAVRQQVETLQQRLRDQEDTFSQASTRFLQNEAASFRSQEQLRERIEQLEQLRDERNGLLEQERNLLQQQETNTRSALEQLSSSLSLIEPQIRSVLNAYERRSTGAVTSRTPPLPHGETRSSAGPTEPTRDMSQRLAQANDALTTHQNISRQNLEQREAVLTCPISLELFVDPVSTSCCGKTFSGELLRQALARNAECPVCRARRITTSANRDMAALVELHLSERRVLGLP